MSRRTTAICILLVLGWQLRARLKREKVPDEES